jgi:TolB-like protein/Tfp pilus assembly protein PilF
MLYELSSGRRPFEGASTIELASAILRDAPSLVTDLRHDLPPDLGRLIRRCLEKEPRNRPQTAREVNEECRRLTREVSATGRAAVSPPPPPPQGSGLERRDAGFWVAVLPFKHTGASPDLAALAEGLSEEIVTGLARFSYLRVIARSSTSRDLSSGADVRTIGRAIGARYVMEGSVRQAGTQLRVAVQLVDAASGAHVWAETYNLMFRPDAIFEAQDDLVPRIVATVADVNGVLPRSMGDVLRTRDLNTLTAHEVVLRGWSYYTRIAPDEHRDLRDVLERTVERITDDADAWALLSLLYQDEYAHGFNPRPAPLDRALEAAQRAVDLAPSNHIAHFALAYVLFFRREAQAFRRAAERAIALNPMDGNTIATAGFLTAYAGDWTRGIPLVERGIALNPHHPGWFWLPLFYDAYRRRDYAAALDAAVKVNMPGYFFAHAVRVAVHGQLGDRDAAREVLDRLLRIKPDFARIAREEYGKWFVESDLLEHILDGLRKGGLDVPASATSDVQPGAAASARVAPVTPSIAVLPFTDMSADKDQEYFSDGLAEEIITLLTRVPGLKVIARTSAFAFRGKEQDIRAIADALGVRTILQGSVRRAGARVRVTAQLIDAAGGDHLWSERFDREMTEVFGLQDDIASAIANALKVTLTGAGAGERAHEPNVAAYEAFLKGRHHYYQFSPEAFARAEEQFTRAAALDPVWAEPHAALGDLYFALGFYAWRPLDDMMARARSEAIKAVELVPGHPMAHAVLGTIAALHEYDWTNAEPHIRQARASDTLPLNGRLLCGAFYALALGRFDDALQELATAVAHDPLNAFWRARQSWILVCASRYDEAIVEARKALDFDPSNYQARMMVALALTFQGKLAEARAPAEEVYRTASFDALNTGLLAGLLARAGERDRANEFVATMSGAVPTGMMMYNLVSGDIDAALDWYQKDVEQHRPNAPMIAHAGFLTPLRRHARWPEVARMMNLTPS